MQNNSQIQCPKCGTTIDVQNIQKAELEQEYKQKLQLELDRINAQNQQEAEKLRLDREEFEKKRQRENELFKERINKEKEVIEAQAKQKAEQEQAAAFALLQKELNDKNEKVKEYGVLKVELQKIQHEKEQLKIDMETELQKQLNTKIAEESKKIEKLTQERLEAEKNRELDNYKRQLQAQEEKVKELFKAQAEIAQLQREKEAIRYEAKAEAEQTLTKQLEEERQKIRKAEADRNEMVVKELQKQLEDQKKLTEEMRRKQEQGSMQLQGEVQELAIEEWIKTNFPIDDLEEIKKGARGGDCLQIVHTHRQQHCGSIYYESKRTKDFQPTWIEKFKQDMRERNATFGVIVTEAMPKGAERIKQMDGVWVCTFEEFKGLSFVLRDAVIRLGEAQSAQENRGDKMSMLYSYLTGNEFRMQVEAIVDCFTAMQTDLNAERRAMESIWKKREKQIEKVLHNTSGMYGSIRGIAGNALGSIRALELPGAE